MNNLSQLFMDSLKYVMNQNMFWATMGFTTGMAMFVGVLLYDGNLDQAKKGIWAIFSYAFMIVWLNFIRIFPITSASNFVNDMDHSGMAYAGVATIFYITIAWLIGIFIGVNLFKHKNYKLN